MTPMRINARSVQQVWRWSGTWWVLLIAAVVCALAWIFAVIPLAPRWGTFFEGLAAAGTLVAVGVSVYVAERASKQAERASKQARELTLAAQKAEEEQRLLDDARKLSWWVSEIKDSPVRPQYVRPFLDEGHDLTYGYQEDGDEDGLWAGLCVVTIKNTGDTALSDATLLRGNWWALIKPPEGKPNRDYLKRIGMLPPGETVVAVDIRYDPTPYSFGKLRAYQGANPGVDWIEYRDVSGRYWRRHADGTLEDRPEGALSDFPPGGW